MNLLIFYFGKKKICIQGHESDAWHLIRKLWGNGKPEWWTSNVDMF